MLKITVYCHASSFFCRIQVKITAQKGILQYFRVLVGCAQVIPASLIGVAIALVTATSVAYGKYSALPAFFVKGRAGVQITEIQSPVTTSFITDMARNLIRVGHIVPAFVYLSLRSDYHRIISLEHTPMSGPHGEQFRMDSVLTASLPECNMLLWQY